MSVVIKVENVSKQYRLGNIGTGSLAHDVNRWWYKLRGKEDPYLKIGEENDRSTKANSDYVWSLKDINFEINRGDAVGIIGRNGAGKSTLLKILSRVTTPTSGTAKARGKIASLLEVGTGFHPELTGRENIFLNGAILGMRKKEIELKFDEIVDFAGVEKYIDTPVKRYSSGMYVRLAFGVAAHLEPDILIVDEVLAVGDAEFQKKALGKMNEVSKQEGRTVLFVSHNMTAIKNLCKTVMFMSSGKIIEQGQTHDVINNYLSHNVNSSLLQIFDTPETGPGNEFVKMKKIELSPVLKNPQAPITIQTAINIEFEFWNYIEDASINLSMSLNSILDECVFVVASNVKFSNTGLHSAVCTIPANLLNDGIYYISMLVVNNGVPIYNFLNIITFEVNENRQATGWHGKWPGLLRPKLDFQLT